MANGIAVQLTDEARLTYLLRASDELAVTASASAVREDVSAVQVWTCADTIEGVLLDAASSIVLNEGVRLGVTEDASIATVIQSADVLALLPTDQTFQLNITDVVATLILWSVNDTCRLQTALTGIGEDVGIFSYTGPSFDYKTVVDVCVVQVLTVPANQLSVSVSDGGALNLVEPGDTAGDYRTSDTILAQASESLPAVVGVATTVAIPAAETVGVTATESQPVIQEYLLLSVSDQLATPASDESAVRLPIRSTDSLCVTAQEPHDVFGQFGLLDAVSVASADATPALFEAESVRSDDTCSVTGDESSLATAAFIQGSESLRLAGVEGTPSVWGGYDEHDAVQVNGVDVGTVSWRMLAVDEVLGVAALESGSLFSNFVQVSFQSDAGALGLAEAQPTIIELTEIRTSESAELVLSDDGTVAAELVGRDDLAILPSDTTTTTATVEASETSALGITGEFANKINASAIFVSVFADDTASLDASDQTFDQMFLYKYGIVDDLAFAGTEQAQYADVPLPEIWDGHQGVGYNTLSPDPISYRLSPVNTW